MIKHMVRSLAFHMNSIRFRTTTHTQLFRDFNISKRSVVTKQLTQVVWFTSPPGWYKVNFNGYAKGSPCNVAYGGIFWNYRGFVRGCFTQPLGVQFPFLRRL